MATKTKASEEDTFYKGKSEFHKNAEELLQGKDIAFSNAKTKRERLKIVRDFTNMRPTMSEAEKEEMGRTEVTNHGMFYQSTVQVKAQIASMVTGTKSLLRITVDTDNPEQDLITGQRISKAINRHAIHHKGRFANFWDRVGGEAAIAGGGPVVFPARYGWLPKIAPDMLFPPETDLDSENIPYAFDPVELNITDIRKLKNSVKHDDSNYINLKNIDKIIKQIEDSIKGEGTTTYAYHEETSKSTRGAFNDPNKIKGFWYYEPKWEKSESKVSATLVVYGTNADLSKDTVILAYVDKAYEDAAQWCQLIAVDSEIGGIKNLDTLRGIAEMQYFSALDVEELFNLMMEGAKINARPKVRVTNTANKEDVLKWDIMRDSLVPEGLEEMPFKTNTNALQGPLQILAQNVAGFSATTIGGSNDLRVEALDKQRSNAMMNGTRISDLYNQMESLLETSVWRILAGDTKPGAEGYLDTMAVRDELDKYKIDYKKLAKRKHGRFQWIEVKVNRSIGNGDRVEQLETAKWLMDNMTQFAPESRPLILRMAVVLQTQDPDLAETLVKVPQAIINAQKIVAETESNVIEDIAALGQILPVGGDDIHQDHIPVHLRTMQGWVATDAVRPWDKLDVLIFAGMAQHVGEHMTILMSNKATNAEAKEFVQAYQQIVQSAQSITQRVEEAEGSEQQAMSPKEQSDLQLKWAKMELDARKLGIDISNQERLFAASEARQATIRRGQFTKEIDADRRFKLSEEQLEVQKKTAVAKAAGAKKKTTKTK